MKWIGSIQICDKSQPGRISWTGLITPIPLHWIYLHDRTLSYLCDRFLLRIEGLMKFTPNKKFAFKHFFTINQCFQPTLGGPQHSFSLLRMLDTIHYWLSGLSSCQSSSKSARIISSIACSSFSYNSIAFSRDDALTVNCTTVLSSLRERRKLLFFGLDIGYWGRGNGEQGAG